MWGRRREATSFRAGQAVLVASRSVWEQRLVLPGDAGALSSQLCGFQGPCGLFWSRLPFSEASLNKHNVKITALSARSPRVKKQQVLSGTDFSTLLFSTLLFGCPGLCRDDWTLKSLP